MDEQNVAPIASVDIPRSSGIGFQEESGIIVGSLEKRDGAEVVLVSLPGRAAPEPAIVYPSLFHQPLVSGDRVLLNTTAISLGLGTGGYHFVIAKIDKDTVVPPADAPSGHIMKLRYTPMQVRCLAVEEQASPYHEVLRAADSISGMPIVVASLHSQLAPIAAGIKAHHSRAARIAYIMNDTACLAMGFSTTVPELKRCGLIDTTITAGQAFGGDLEAVNIYSALLAAKHVAQADVTIVAQGPGNVGTETLFGFGSIYQGEVLNAVSVLGGIPIAAARLSFADSRPRHQGLSQQFLISLGHVALRSTDIVLPELDQEKLSILQAQLNEVGIDAHHRVVIESGEGGIAELQRLAVHTSTMGRGVQDDPAFFLAAAAAGAWAGKQNTPIG